MTKRKRPVRSSESPSSVAPGSAGWQESTEKPNANASRNAAYCQDVITHLRWTLGAIIGALAIIVTLVIAFVVYAMFKNSREYDAGVRSAKEAAMQASNWESKAHDRFAAIDDKVTQKLIEIEDKGQEVTARLVEESERHRELIELWARFAALQGGLPGPRQFKYTIGLLERIREVDPNSNAVMEFLPKYHLLLAWQDKADRKEWAQRLIQICQHGDGTELGDRSWFMACAHALLDNEQECRRQMEIACEAGGAVDLDETLFGQILKEKYGNKTWFNEMCPGESES